MFAKLRQGPRSSPRSVSVARSVNIKDTPSHSNASAVLSSAAPVVSSQPTAPYSGAELFIYSHACPLPIAPSTAACNTLRYILYVSYDLRLTNGACPRFFLESFQITNSSARTSCRSQLVRAEEFVFSKRLEKIERLAPSRESTLFFSQIPRSIVLQYGRRRKSDLSK